MKIRALALAAALAAFATPALAFHCPEDGRIIEAAIALNPALRAEQLVFVRALWDGGMALHAAGDHTGSVALLHQAMDMLGLEHA